MGLWDSIKDFGSDIMDGLSGSLLNFGGKAAEDYFIGDANSAEAYKRQKDFYKHRYQWMMKDMEDAGLNPILAAGSAGFSTSGTPSVAQSQMPISDYSGSAKNFAEMSVAQEQATTEQTKQLKNIAETYTEIQRKYKVRAEAGLATAQEKVAFAQWQEAWVRINKMREEVGLIQRNKKVVEVELNKLKLALKELSAQSKVYGTSYGKAMKYIKALTEALGLSTHAGAGATSSAVRMIK